MKQSKMLIPTLREVPTDAEAISHQLLIRAGYIRSNSSGFYTYLPLAKRVIEKIMTILREELATIDAVEVQLPELQPLDMLDDNPAYTEEQAIPFRIMDQQERQYVLAASQENVFVDLISDEIHSYKRLPIILYEIDSAFRDDLRPRFGLLRSREYILKEAYSFHSSDESLDDCYRMFEDVYRNIFERCGLNYRVVSGVNPLNPLSESKEFMALAPIGEETICYSTDSDYAADIRVASSLYVPRKSHASLQPLEKIATTDGQFYELEATQKIKATLFMVEEQPTMVLVRGDHEVNQGKLERLVKNPKVREATEEEITTYLGGDGTSVGPISLPEEVRLFADFHVQDLANVSCGSNQAGYAFLNVNPGRDFQPEAYEDLRYVKEGELSPDGQGTLAFTSGIEIAQTSKFGTLLSQKQSATILDESGQSQAMLVGSYHLGISRLLAAIVEQTANETGMIWPKEIAPFDVHIVQMNMQDSYQSKLAEEMEEELTKAHYEVLVDDRDERAGVKFTDADLIGCPLRLTIGKKAVDGVVELKFRESGEMLEVRKEELVSTLAILAHSANQE